MPTNLYGPNDNYHPDNSHVLPGLLLRIHQAKKQNAPEVVIWGDGSPLREFLHVDDLAQACLFMLKNYNQRGFLNIGSSSEISIAQLAELIKNIVGYTGNLRYDTTKPNGTPRKLMDSSQINELGWHATTTLSQGIQAVYDEIKKTW
jgi:GDP-L-fucose synthase